MSKFHPAAVANRGTTAVTAGAHVMPHVQLQFTGQLACKPQRIEVLSTACNPAVTALLACVMARGQSWLQPTRHTPTSQITLTLETTMSLCQVCDRPQPCTAHADPVERFGCKSSFDDQATVSIVNCRSSRFGVPSVKLQCPMESNVNKGSVDKPCISTQWPVGP